MVETLTSVIVAATAVAWGRAAGPICAAWVRDLVRELDPGRAEADATAFTRVLEGRAT